MLCYGELYKGWDVYRNLNRRIAERKYLKALRFARLFSLKLVRTENMGLLLQTATSFGNLFDIRYDFILGKKNKSTNISVLFEPTDFFHLAGFQYIKDVPNLKKSRSKIYSEICNNYDLRNKIYNSSFYSKIIDRLQVLNQLEYLFDNNHLIFQYDYKRNKQSSIRANFLIETLDAYNIIVYVFGEYASPYNSTAYCKSIFPKGAMDYSKYQSKYTILKKTKIQVSTNTVISSYINPNYMP